MNTKVIIGLAAVVLITGGAYYFSTTKTGDSSGMNMTPEQRAAMHHSSGNASNTSPMLAEPNAVVVTDQRPGKVVTGTVYLAAPGYLVIHDESGTVLGSSALLPAGQSNNVKVVLSRASKNDEKLMAMLHSDTDGNGSFDASKDVPVQSKLGGAIQGSFQVSSRAGANTPVSI